MSGIDVKGTARAEAGLVAADQEAVDQGRLGVEKEAAEARFFGVA